MVSSKAIEIRQSDFSYPGTKENVEPWDKTKYETRASLGSENNAEYWMQIRNPVTTSARPQNGGSIENLARRINGIALPILGDLVERIGLVDRFGAESQR